MPDGAEESMLMLTITEIQADPESKRAVTEDMVRRMYELLGTNMTQVVNDFPADWRAEDEFQKWRTEVFLGSVQRHTRHLLLSDSMGLRGFLSYTPLPDGDDIFINEVQIRSSCQGDGVTIRRLMREFAKQVAILPHHRLVAYANKANGRSQRLATKIGFHSNNETARGYSYEMPKQTILRWRGIR
ncbi:MAG: hypothetical protein WC869_14570 [Phycisphaerae bacterium]|jgi:hypothetical protein